MKGKSLFVIVLVYFVDCMSTHELTVIICEFWDLMHLQLCCTQLLGSANTAVIALKNPNLTYYSYEWHFALPMVQDQQPKM